MNEKEPGLGLAWAGSAGLDATGDSGLERKDVHGGRPSGRCPEPGGKKGRNPSSPRDDA